MSDCIFCKIVKKEIPAAIVFEDNTLIVFKDIHPKAPVHLLIAPKNHLASLNDIDEATAGQLIIRAKLLAEEQGIAESGYKLVINCGSDGGQLVPHLHLHLLGGELISGVV